MANINNRVKLWRGTRANYNALSSYDYWTEYSVHETDGSWKKYFGTKEVTGGYGELAAVEGVLTPAEFGALDASAKTQGYRWLVGSGSTYYIVEFGPQGADDPQSVRIEPLGSYSVRVKDRGLKAYEIVNGELYTYDEVVEAVDCGATISMSASTPTVLATIGDEEITAKVAMNSLTIAGANSLTDGITFDGTTDIEILVLDCGEY